MKTFFKTYKVNHLFETEDEEIVNKMYDLYAHNEISNEDIVSEFKDKFIENDYNEDIMICSDHITDNGRYAVIFDPFESFLDIYQIIG